MLITTLIYILFGIAIVWAINYLLDLLPIDGNIRKLILFLSVIAVFYVIAKQLGYTG